MKEENLIYLDYNATTPPAAEVARAMEPFLQEKFGNPSCVYSLGQETKKAVAENREKVARLLNARPGEIVFTSGGTEGNNFALKGAAWARKEKGHIITSAIEHSAVTGPCEFLESQGFEVTYLPVDKEARVSVKDVEEALREDTFLISLMAANNEVGTLQPIAEVGHLARQRGILFHSDAAQIVGKLPVDVKVWNVDLLTVAGHKFYGPKGVGALYIREGIEVENLFHGAGHERGRRGGTEDILAIAGLGKACELAERELAERAGIMQKTRDLLWELLESNVEGIRRNGHPLKTLPNTLSVSFQGILAADLMDKIKDRVAFSPGAACHSDGKVKISQVLKAMGVSPPWAQGTVRFSTGRDTSVEEIKEAASIVIAAIGELRR